MFRYRPASDRRTALAEILTFLSSISHLAGLILDDANSYCTLDDLHDLAAAASEQVHLVVVWSQGDQGQMDRGILSARSISVTWEDIRPTLRSLLLEHEIAVVEALQCLIPKNDSNRICLTGLGDSLAARFDRYSESSATVSEFLFLLRGGHEILRPVLLSLHDSDRADAPVLYAAAEQIAGFERAVEPIETAALLKKLRSVPQQPEPSPNWVAKVFDRESQARRMVHRRGMFTTVHRDWARALLVAGLAEARTHDTTREILERDFNVISTDPSRLSRMWSWIWSANGAGRRFIQDWAAGLDFEQWKLLVQRCCSAGIANVGFLAGRMHLLFREDAWTRTVATAMESNEDPLVACLRAAVPEEWYYINECFMAVNHAAPQLGDKLRIAWGARSVADLISTSPVITLGRANWCFSNVLKRQPEWCREVCGALNWPQVEENLWQVPAGDIEAVCDTWTLFERFGYPMRRSMLRVCVDAMCVAVASARPQDVHASGLNELSMLLVLFLDEIDRFFGSIDDERWATELASSHPRHWSNTLWLIELARYRGDNFLWGPLAHLNIDAFARNVEIYAPAAPYEFRCLLWLLGSSTEVTRERLASTLEPTVEKVMRTSESERNAIATAFLSLSPQRAERLFVRLREEGIVIVTDPVERSDFASKTADVAEALRTRDASGEDYVVRDAIGL